MNKILLAALAALSFCVPASAQQRWSMMAPMTFVVTSTITPGATGTNSFALQNTSAVQDVYINRIDVVSQTSGTATGGLVQYLVFTSTVITAGGTSQVQTLSYATPFGAAFSGIVASTGPVNVLLESGLPILPPLLVNDAPGTTTSTNSSATYVDNVPVTAALYLPHGANRGIVFQKVKTGTTDVTDGSILFRIVYTVK